MSLLLRTTGMLGGSAWVPNTVELSSCAAITQMSKKEKGPFVDAGFWVTANLYLELNCPTPFRGATTW
jgi:hypothetical protein